MCCLNRYENYTTFVYFIRWLNFNIKKNYQKKLYLNKSMKTVNIN